MEVHALPSSGGIIDNLGFRDLSEEAIVAKDSMIVILNSGRGSSVCTVMTCL